MAVAKNSNGNGLRAAVNRTRSQAYRAFLLMQRDAFRLLDVTVWPLVLYFSTILFAGFLAADPQIIGLVVMGALGWRILYHFQMEPAQGYMDEYWSDSLQQLMVSPIRRTEFFLGGTASAVLKGIVVTLLFLGLGSLLFGLRINDPLLLLGALAATAACGVILGIFSLGVAFLKGSDSFAFLFAFSDALAVFSGVFYPTSIFPEPLHTIVQALPTTHAFDMLKSNAGLGPANYFLFFVTAAVWLAFALWFNNWAFRKARQEGKLARLG